MKQPDEKGQPLKKKTAVKFVTATDDDANQRLDNFLIKKMKNVPKSRVYRLVRKGEVRVNKGRVSVSYRLMPGDVVRLPPVHMDETGTPVPPSKTTMALLSDRILYEDADLIILNKPAGMSVHVGSTVRVGVIETMRHMYPKLPDLELAHRLDSETSGCLILAKKKRVLRELHGLLREGQVTKIYWTLTKGKWKDSELRVDVPLHKDYQDGGKHVVEVDEDGKEALTVFRPLKILDQAALMEVRLHTGRTHQIRVHAQYRGHPIAGDDRYGDSDFNKRAKQLGLRRMFLHARSIDFVLPSTNQRITVEAPLDNELEAAIQSFSKDRGHDGY